MLETLRRIAVSSDRCILLVTHDVRVFPYGDRIAEMVDGRIVRFTAGGKDLSHA